MRNKSPERLGPSPVIALLLCATLMSLDCDSPTTPRRARTTFLSYSSDSGDFIGQGQSHRYVLSDGQWRANFDTYLTYIEHVSVTFTGDSATWQLDVAAPANQSLRTGSYASAARFPIEHPAKPGLSFVGDGRGCNTVSGSFEVLDIAIAADGSVNRLHVKFEQHCEGQQAALRGELSIVASP